MPKSFNCRITGRTINDVSAQLRLSEQMLVNMFPDRFKSGQVDDMVALRDLGPAESAVVGNILTGPVVVFQTAKHVQGTARSSQCCKKHEHICDVTLANLSHDQLVQVLLLAKSWDRPTEPQGTAPTEYPGQPAESEEVIG